MTLQAPRFLISIHAPTRGATWLVYVIIISPLDISIHAPTRGATPYLLTSLICQYISIHAPTRGATHVDFYDVDLPIEFQSTHPRGVRQRTSKTDGDKLINFNPRTHEGCDITLTLGSTTDSVFQSTHPRGVRHDELLAEDGREENFNPRTHEGCDMRCLAPLPCNFKISIHAPTRGATCSSRILLCRSTHFNPRTHEGCDSPTERPEGRAGKFQSTHPRGVRPKFA